MYKIQCVGEQALREFGATAQGCGCGGDKGDSAGFLVLSGFVSEEDDGSPGEDPGTVGGEIPEPEGPDPGPELPWPGPGGDIGNPLGPPGKDDPPPKWMNPGGPCEAPSGAACEAHCKRQPGRECVRSCYSWFNPLSGACEPRVKCMDCGEAIPDLPLPPGRV
jgi:hypothetical protein